MAPPSSTIASLADVTTPMRLLCKDIVDGVMDATFSKIRAEGGPLRELMDRHGSFPQMEDGLWRRVFKPTEGPAWNSDLPVPDPGIPSRPTPFDLRIQAGTLFIDAAPPDTNRRIIPWTVRMLEPPAEGARRCGEPVFLEPRYDPWRDDKLHWFWSDMDGKAVDPRITVVHVINNPVVIFKFHLVAVSTRDATMFMHALRHNTQVGVHQIRCRLNALIASGLSPELMPPFPSAGNSEDFVSPSYMTGIFRRELDAGPNPDVVALAKIHAAQVRDLYEYYHEQK